MSENADRYCGACRFFEAHPRNPGDLGWCKRYPPQPAPEAPGEIVDALSLIHWVLTKGGTEHTNEDEISRLSPESHNWFTLEVARWPQVEPGEWCGEFQRGEKY